MSTSNNRGEGFEYIDWAYLCGNIFPISFFKHGPHITMLMLIGFCVIICHYSLFPDTTEGMTEQMEFWELPQFLSVQPSGVHSLVNSSEIKHGRGDEGLLDDGLE